MDGGNGKAAVQHISELETRRQVTMSFGEQIHVFAFRLVQAGGRYPGMEEVNKDIATGGVQVSDDRGQRTEDGGQRSEDRSYLLSVIGLK